MQAFLYASLRAFSRTFLQPTVLAALLSTSLLFSLTTRAQGQESAPGEVFLQAPTHLYPEPDLYMLLRLPGDRAQFRYTPGSLDRSANLQMRLELASRAFEKWTKQPLRLQVFILSREEWGQVGIPIVYGMPVRVGEQGIAGPAAGDPGTVKLWDHLLAGSLPVVPGLPLRGTPQEAATMILADRVVQLQAAEMLVDQLGLTGGEHWVRGVVAHVVDLSLLNRFEPGRGPELDTMYSLFARRHAAKSFAAKDYDPAMPLADWLWFQAQFHFGAKAILEKAGKGAVKAMLRLDKKGVLTGERLRDRFPKLAEWYHSSFSAVSMRSTPP